MWVQVDRSVYIAGKQYISDEVVDMPDSEAAIWIASGHVHEIDGINTNTDRIEVLEGERLRWLGTWQSGTDYLKNDVVIDDGVQAVALVDTGAKAGPVFANDASYQIPDAPTWTTGQLSASTLEWANEFIIADTCVIDSFRVWIPSTSSNVWYRIRTADLTDPAQPVQTVYPQFNGGDIGAVTWATVNAAGVIAAAGSVIAIVVESWNDLSQSAFDATYNYSTPNNPLVPSNGQITHDNKNTGRIRVAYVDADTLDWTSELQSLAAGDRIAASGTEWLITGTPIEFGSYIEFPITPSVQVGEAQLIFRFTAFGAQPIDYSLLPDYWQTPASQYLSTVTGYVSIAGQEPVSNDNSYGIDIRLEGVTKSPDWDWMSTFSLDALTGSRTPAVGVESTALISQAQQPLLHVEHEMNYVYEDVGETPVDITQWDEAKTIVRGGMDWGTTPDKAEIPVTGLYEVEGSFIVLDGGNTEVTIELVKDSGGGPVLVIDAIVTTQVNVHFPINIDTVTAFDAGDLIWFRVHTDNPANADVEIHQGIAQIEPKWMV